MQLASNGGIIVCVSDMWSAQGIHRDKLFGIDKVPSNPFKIFSNSNEDKALERYIKGSQFYYSYPPLKRLGIPSSSVFLFFSQCFMAQDPHSLNITELKQWNSAVFQLCNILNRLLCLGLNPLTMIYCIWEGIFGRVEINSELEWNIPM